GLFRREIFGGANDSSCTGNVRGLLLIGLGGVIEDFGEAKVGQDDAPIGMKEDVAGFEVAMDDAACMGVVEGSSGLIDDGDDCIERKATTFCQEVAKGTAGN